MNLEQTPMKEWTHLKLFAMLSPFCCSEPEMIEWFNEAMVRTTTYDCLCKAGQSKIEKTDSKDLREETIKGTDGAVSDRLRKLWRYIFLQYQTGIKSYWTVAELQGNAEDF